MILCIDVGKGTEDIMVLDSLSEEYIVQNSIQVVVPSTAQLLKKKLLSSNEDIWYFTGQTMAGEPWNRVIYDKASTFPNSIFMTPEAAMSLRYHLPQVESHGVIIQDNPPDSEFKQFTLSDISWERISAILETSGVDKHDIDYVLLACQDHGFPDNPEQSSRDFRMRTIYNLLDQNGRLQDLLVPANQIPDHLPRHQSIARSALQYMSHLNEDHVYVMDSSPAVVMGVVNGEEREMIINVGNGHTLAIILHNRIVQAVYETHTGAVKPDKLLDEIKLLLSNNLSHKESLKRGGHGVYIRTPFPEEVSLEDYYPISLIGPKREKLRDFPGTVFDHPVGNMMMAGPFGLYRALKFSFENSN